MHGAKMTLLAATIVLLGACSDSSSESPATDAGVPLDTPKATEAAGLPESPPIADSGQRPRLDSGDPLQDALFEVVLGLMEKKPGDEELVGYFTKLSDVFVAGGTTVGATLEFSIKDTLDAMVLAIDKVRPAAGLTYPLDPTQLEAIRSQTAKFSTDLRNRAMPKAGGQHDGKVMTGKSITELEVKKGYEPLTWKRISDYTYKEGMELPAPIRDLAGKKVALTGYMMAMGRFEHIKEFLLVESYWTCCFGQVPELNQVIVVRMPEDHIGLDLMTRPIIVHGTLEVGEVKEGNWVISLYRLVADSAEEVD